MGKFSKTENAKYLEKAYETNFSLSNPILSYRCLNELDWLDSSKTDQYVSNLELDNSITARLILLYYWDSQSINPKFKDLINDNELLNFIALNEPLGSLEKEISHRLFAFEIYISELYYTTPGKIINISDFESVAKNYFSK